MGKAKRAHQFHEAGQCQSFEGGRQIDFREKDREKKSVPSDLDCAHQFLWISCFFNRSSVVRH